MCRNKKEKKKARKERNSWKKGGCYCLEVAWAAWMKVTFLAAKPSLFWGLHNEALFSGLCSVKSKEESFL